MSHLTPFNRKCDMTIYVLTMQITLFAAIFLSQGGPTHHPCQCKKIHSPSRHHPSTTPKRAGITMPYRKNGPMVCKPLLVIAIIANTAQKQTPCQQKGQRNGGGLTMQSLSQRNLCCRALTTVLMPLTIKPKKAPS